MLKQIGLLLSVALRSIPQRAGAAFVIVIGVGGVVAVIVSVMSMAGGLRKVFSDTGHADRAIVVNEGATSEGVSTLTSDAVTTIENAPGMKHSAREGALASAEVLVAASVPRRSNGTPASISVRGVAPVAALIRPELRIVSGRMFRSGLHELIAGQAARRQFSGMEVGDHLTLRGDQWTVVGTFSSAGDLHESELMTDAKTLMSAFERSLFSAVTVQLSSADSFSVFESALRRDPTLSVEVSREADYYARQSRSAATLMYRAAVLVGLLMTLGAILAAFNTMYSVVRARTGEIATLRAMGFAGAGAAMSVVAEALLLSVLGGALGALLAWAMFNGNTLSTLGGFYDNQIVFQIHVDLKILAAGILLGCLVGLVGGLAPAFRAARIPVTDALRALE